MYGAQGGRGCLVVAHGDGAGLLQACEEVLDQVARLVQMPVLVALHLASTDAGDDHSLARLRRWFEHRC